MQGKKLWGGALKIRNLQPITSNMQPSSEGYGRLRKGPPGRYIEQTVEFLCPHNHP